MSENYTLLITVLPSIVIISFFVLSDKFREPPSLTFKDNTSTSTSISISVGIHINISTSISTSTSISIGISTSINSST